MNACKIPRIEEVFQLVCGGCNRELELPAAGAQKCPLCCYELRIEWRPPAKVESNLAVPAAVA